MRLTKLIPGPRFAAPPKPARPAPRSRRLSAVQIVAMLAAATTTLVALIVVAALMEARLASAASPPAAVAADEGAEPARKMPAAGSVPAPARAPRVAAERLERARDLPPLRSRAPKPAARPAPVQSFDDPG